MLYPTGLQAARVTSQQRRALRGAPPGDGTVPHGLFGYRAPVERDEWQAEMPMELDGRVVRGIPVWSLPLEVAGHSGPVEGRTTGSRQPCRARYCGGWQIGVKWATGQQMFLCSRGWTYDSEAGAVRMTAGTGLSTTTATDRPNTRRPPPPRSAWTPRDRLGPAWQE